MKISKKLIAPILVLLSSVAMAGTPVKVLSPISHVYSPLGFDSNDNTEVVIEGFLPNLCHKHPMTESKIVGNKIEITVSSYVYDQSNPFCPEVIVPFVESVQLGLLMPGNYEIVVNGGSVFQEKGAIQVNKADNSSVDDYVYAAVEYIKKDFGSRRVMLEGVNPSDCFALEEVRFVSNGKDTYSVLPKMKQVSNDCRAKQSPFSYEVEVPDYIKSDRILLHARAMGGKSVNSIFINPGL